MYGLFNFFRDFIGDIIERRQVLNSFNMTAKHAYYSREATYLAKARTTIGNSAFRHELSKMRSGFTIKVYGAHGMNKAQATEIAMALLDNGAFMRQLMAIGYDTLEIESEIQRYQWSISDYHSLSDFTLNAAY